MIQLDLEVDWTEVDGAINRLLTAVQPAHINNLAARTAWKQVKTKYPGRWRSQVKVSSKGEGSWWQQAKQKIQGEGKGFGSYLTGLDFAGKPGFLTGTTYRSITAESDYRRGRVYPKGRWPLGVDSDCANLPVTYESADGMLHTGSAMYFKWGNDGLEFHLGPGYQYETEGDQASPSYRRDERMTEKKYFADWLFLDSEDIELVISNTSALFEYAIQNDQAGIRNLYRSTRFNDTLVPIEDRTEAEPSLQTEAPDLQHISVDIHDAHIQVYQEIFRDYVFKNGTWVYRGGEE